MSSRPLSLRLPRNVLRRAVNRVRMEFEAPAPTEGIHPMTLEGLTLFLDLGQHTHRKIYRQRGFEPGLTDALERSVEPGDVFADIGANFGWHSLNLAHRRPDLAALRAFEPGRQVHGLFERSLAANPPDPRLELRRLAVGREPGEGKLKHFDGLGSVNASLYPLGDLDYQEEVVEIQLFDSLVRNFPAAPAVVKCDVEGAEKDVLLGSRALNAGELGDPPMWFLEANYETSGMAGYFPWELIDLAAEGAPYRGYVLSDGGLREMASRTALRHGATLVLAVKDVHQQRLERIGLS